jgi:hypothetical protein
VAPSTVDGPFAKVQHAVSPAIVWKHLRRWNTIHSNGHHKNQATTTTGYNAWLPARASGGNHWSMVDTYRAKTQVVMVPLASKERSRQWLWNS